MMRIESCVPSRRVLIVGLGLLLSVVAASYAQEPRPTRPPRPRDPSWPVAWASYRPVKSLEEDIADLKSHGVGLISMGTRNVEECRRVLAIARRTGMKFHIDFPDITENAGLVRVAKLEPVDALMIGGVYRGKAIDRHVFSFEPRKHEITMEPPVYNKGLPYTRGSGGTGAPKATERVGHYFPDIPEPVKVEIIVPLRAFDGQQHLKILPATITPAPAGTKLDVDSVAPDLPSSPEIQNRKLYRISFDLSGMEGAMLNQVGIAVYWPYHGSSAYWMFRNGNVSAQAASTKEALRREVRRVLGIWSEANGGTFPGDVVLAARFGDECFYITGHANSPACSYPLWDYSEPAIRAYAARAGQLEHPRTWGYPEIYGPDAFAWWMYTLHEGCANLAGVVREEIAKLAPGLLLFRNTTRMGVFSLSNDHDGSGQELLARNLDVIHLDPYPVFASSYSTAIPVDMSYCAGLARRYNRLLVPWMQAHTYGGPGGLVDPSPEQIDRMANEQWAQGVDAVIWLGYGNTFPKVRPDSWERAAGFHQRLAQSLPPKPQAKLAVLRHYRAWALSSTSEDQIRNPAEWMLQQMLYVWAVKYKQPYDVFEVPPVQSANERDAMEQSLRKYAHIVSTEPREGAWVIGAGTQGQMIPSSRAKAVQQEMEQELFRRGWLGQKPN